MEKILVPYHVAIIPDGNRRWARERNLPTFEGHRRGFDNMLNVGKKARERGVKIFTLWAFSTENWKRTVEEVGYLMKLYEQVIDAQIKTALKDEIRIVHLGRKDRIPFSLRKKIMQAEEETAHFDKYFFVVGLDYGGRDEVVRAIMKASHAKKSLSRFDEKEMNSYLDTSVLPHPEPDLIIRTSGEERLSGFMMWQAAYSEYIFTKKYCPDFYPKDFELCLDEYERRKRRFGK
jgi:undecaprenyl diphosphate synthase